MNEAAKLVADSALGISFKTVFIGKDIYTIHPPTMKTMCRIISHWSMCPFEYSDKTTETDVIGQIPSNYKHLVRGVASSIVGDSPFWQVKDRLLSRKLNPTSKELKEVMTAIKDLIGTEDFFYCANLAKNVGSLIAKQKL